LVADAPEGHLDSLFLGGAAGVHLAWMTAAKDTEGKRLRLSLQTPRGPFPIGLCPVSDGCI